MTNLLLVGIGVWLFQDAVASIIFYPQEKWLWNHCARIVRAAMGLGLVVVAMVNEH